MHLPLSIEHIDLGTADIAPTFVMTRRCGVAICVEGEFDVKILNEVHTVSQYSMFACMPFVSIKVLAVRRPAKVILGLVDIDDVPVMINRWVNAGNLFTIQSRPLVRIPEDRFARLINSIDEYTSECSEYIRGSSAKDFDQLQHDIIDLRSRLVIAQVLKIYFALSDIEVTRTTQRDIVFQRFMLALYTNFREHRTVHFYASMSGVSLKYFSTLIRQLSGSSPSEWIETAVVGEAKTLLTDLDRSIKEIATYLNFPDTPTFTKYFHRVTGMTPRAYRQSLLR